MMRVIILGSLFFYGCKNSKGPIDNNNTFKFPVIIQSESIDTIKAITAEEVSEYYPPLIGRFKFGDSINMAFPNRERLSEKDYLWEVKYALDSDSFSTDGLELMPDYQTTVVYSGNGYQKGLYFPVYVVNNTQETKIFFGKDSHGFAIQEAIDTSHFSLWHPIESQPWDFCGNGYFRKKLKPREFLMFLMPKYAGKEVTSLRIRFEIGQTVLISRTYQGTIDQKQFEIKKDNWIFDRLKESKGYASSYLFYGARPKGEWE